MIAAAASTEGLLDEGFFNLASMLGLSGGLGSLLATLGVVLIAIGVVQLFGRRPRAGLLKISAGAFCSAPFIIWGAVSGLASGLLDLLLAALESSGGLLAG